MIAYIKGTAEDMTEASVVIDNHGIGYEIFMTGRALARIRIGETCLIHTYFHVKEDGMQLFGFFSKDDLRMFRLLLQVNGVGPKGALGVLSAFSSDELRLAVLADDVKAISRAPGIGKKTAQKLILELKDKIDLAEVIEQKTSGATDVSALGEEAGEERNAAIEALTALGYSPTEALRAVRKVPLSEGADASEILRQALKNL